MSRPTSLREMVKDNLIEKILSGEFAPGYRLLEMQLAEDFDVSQAPVREALRDLEAIGLVEKQSNRGSFVSNLGVPPVRGIFHVRGALEELATRLAASSLATRGPELQAEVDAMVEAASRSDSAGVSAHSLAFHTLIIDAPGNPVLSAMWRNLGIEKHTKTTVQLRSEHLHALAVSHQPIVDSILAGDVDVACRIARDHQADLDEILASEHPNG